VALKMRLECPFRVSRYEPGSRHRGVGGLPGVGGGEAVASHRSSPRVRVDLWFVGLLHSSTQQRGNRDTPHPPSRLLRRRIPVRAVRSSGSTQRSHCLPGLLSWGSFKDRPSIDITGERSSQAGRSLPFDSSEPPLECGPSMSFLPTSTAQPLTSLRVCCTPQPTMGFARFWTAAEAAALLTGAHPPKLFPRRQPSRVTTSRALSPLTVRPDCRVLPPGSLPRDLDLKALIRRRVRCESPALPLEVARCFHGLLDPSRVCGCHTPEGAGSPHPLDPKASRDLGCRFAPEETHQRPTSRRRPTTRRDRCGAPK
jgi:hypothetical protein